MIPSSEYNNASISRLNDYEFKSALLDAGLKSSHFKNLPLEIIKLIFQELKIEDLQSPKLRKVCKAFNQIASDPSVIGAVARRMGIEVLGTDDSKIIKDYLSLNDLLKKKIPNAWMSWQKKEGERTLAKIAKLSDDIKAVHPEHPLVKRAETILKIERLTMSPDGTLY